MIYYRKALFGRGPKLTAVQIDSSSRAADLNDSISFCMMEEAVKPAFMRKKVSQGRNSDSQK